MDNPNNSDQSLLNADYCASLISSFLQQAKRGDYDAYQQVRTIRSKIYRDTVDIANRGEYYVPDCGLVEIEKAKYMQGATRFYSKEIPAREPVATGYETDFNVVNEDCLLTAQRLALHGANPLVLNMASRRNPGGGVTTGAGAQEETIFRRSNLFQSLYQFAPYASLYGLERRAEHYPLDRNFGGIYSPEVTIFREGESQGYRLMASPYRAAFVSVAGINRPDLTSDGLIVADQALGVKNKIRTLLRIALMNGHATLILGALGCGAFRNPPHHVARLFHEVFDEREFKNQFKTVIFAILDDHNAHLSHNPSGNFAPFLHEFGG